MMKPKKWVFVLFWATVAVQLGFVAVQVAGNEGVLAGGRDYKFRTVPIDPHDAFRGKYVSLRFEAVRFPNMQGFRAGEDILAGITTGDDGFAKLSGLYRKQDMPKDGIDYVEVKVAWTDEDKKELAVQYPFNMYFMNENFALKAEQAFRTATAKQQGYALVRIKGGRAMLKGLYIDGKKIEDYVREKDR